MTAAVCPPRTLPGNDARAAVMRAAACIAIGLPALLAFNLPPSATFLNQAAALGGWGLFMLVVAVMPGDDRWHRRMASFGLKALLGAIAILVGMALLSPWMAALPSGLALSSAGLLGAAMVVAAISAAARQQRGLGTAAFEAFCVALVATGVLSLALALVQGPPALEREIGS